MMNCNPETVSTDYDTSSRLYFEPITVEDVLNVIDVVGAEAVALVQCFFATAFLDQQNWTGAAPTYDGTHI